ncbi:MAG: phenylalanine--tRNA ligase beta subunit-related protein [Muribaculaceae bacterium]
MKIAVVRANVQNTPTCNDMWSELTNKCNQIKDNYKLLEINNRPAIATTRELYKKLGKDPNRYRVSSEALCRRAIKGMELYRINTLVDIINLVSITSGYAIGGFDADMINGDLALGVGLKDERFEAIGRGLLNIENLPIYRDSIGGIGTPTSDEERTKITLNTTHIHININAFSQEMPLDETINYTTHLLIKYAKATNITTDIL